MRKQLLILTLFIFLTGCSEEKNYVYWTVTESSQIKRLEEAQIDFIIKNGEIWVNEEDMKKVVVCCS